MDTVDGVEWFTDFDTKRVATRVAYGPEAESKAVLGLGFIRARCHVLVSFLSIVAGRAPMGHS
jgi:hypothetical protein